MFWVFVSQLQTQTLTLQGKALGLSFLQVVGPLPEGGVYGEIVSQPLLLA